ncbi:hypothetical protein R1flu_006766 [Riccia fluitans]|uniref:CST complex subunit CTC1 n=1 Tax=Riccia fluitans TaxID=41844 RepID=A0ABD1Z113_9MARC
MEVTVTKPRELVVNFSTLVVDKPEDFLKAARAASFNEVVLGKRNAVQSFGEIARNVKKLKSGSQSLQILHDSNDLVGRLLLCNKKRHSWGGLSAAADCLAFTDSTASVCCSVSQGLVVSFVGKLVRVNSRSFVPFTGPHSGHGSTKSRRGAAESTDEAHKVSSNSPRSRECEQRNCIRAAMNIGEERSSADGSGFLEIHSMELLEEESLDLPTFPSLCVDPAAADIHSALFESPLIKQKEKGSRLTICGKLQCISPQFSLPSVIISTPGAWVTKRKIRNLGVSLQISTPALQIIVKMEWTPTGTIKKRRDYLYVYFSGSIAAWRPFLSGNIKRYITVSGLRRKLVITGAVKKHQFLLVATRTSLILPVFDPSHIGIREPHISLEKDSGRDRAYGDTTDLGECTRKIECFSKSGCSNYPRVISYAGFVTEVLFQGILLELDKRVWLLLTQQETSHVHGVRIGSMLVVRDAHTITINTPSEKALLLGACLRLHVSVLRFSPLHSS